MNSWVSDSDISDNITEENYDSIDVFKEKKLHYCIHDIRLKTDPLASEFREIMQAPFRAKYTYDYIRGLHIVRFFGVWSGYLPSQVDWDSPLFKTLSESNFPLEISTFNKLVDNFRMNVAFPCFESANTNDRVSLCLFWFARAHTSQSTFWNSVLVNPELLCYPFNNNPKPFEKVFNILNRFSSVPTICGIPCISIYGGISVNLMEMIPNSPAWSQRRVAFLENEAFYRDFNGDQLVSSEYICFHCTFHFNTPHCTIFELRDTFLAYLVEKAEETWKNCVNLIGSPGRVGGRILEGVATYCQDQSVKLLSLLGMYLPMLSYVKAIEPIPNVSAWLDCAKSFIDNDANEEVRMLMNSTGVIWMPSCLYDIHTQVQTSIYPNIMQYKCDIDTLIELVGTMPSEEVLEARSYLKWIELPAGEERVEMVDLESLITPLSYASFNLKPCAPSSYRLEDLIGQTLLSTPTLGARPAEELAYAKELFKQTPSDGMYTMMRKTRSGNLMVEVLQREAKRYQDFSIQPKLGTMSWFTRGLLFDEVFEDVISEGRETRLPTSEVYRMNRLNNSSVKVFSAFVAFYKLFCSDELIGSRGTFQVGADIMDRVVICGAINEPVVGILKRLFPGIRFLGIGADAIGSHERTTIEGAVSRNLSSNLIISDIDQTSFRTFERMVDETCILAVAFCSYASHIFMKVNYPSTYLLNEIHARIAAAGMPHTLYTFALGGQNAITPECFVYMTTAPYSVVGIPKDAWFSMHTPCAVRYSDIMISQDDIKVLQDGVKTCIASKEIGEDFLQPGNLVAYSIHTADAHSAINLSLEMCCPVYSWKNVQSNNPTVNVIGVPSRSRMLLSLRSKKHFKIKSGDELGTKGVFGVCSRPPVFSALSPVSWLQILGAGMRQMLMDIGFGILPNAKRVVSIGSRNLTDVIIPPNVDLVCYDTYYVYEHVIGEKYNITIKQEIFDFEKTPLLDDSIYIANFVIMAPVHNSTPPSKEKQLKMIKSFLQRLYVDEAKRSCFVWNLYAANFSHDYEASKILPKGLVVTRHDGTPQYTIGRYQPCDAIYGTETLEVMRPFIDHVTNAGANFLPFQSLVKTCVDNMWVPDIDGSVGMLLSTQLSYGCWYARGLNVNLDYLPPGSSYRRIKDNTPNELARQQKPQTVSHLIDSSSQARTSPGIRINEPLASTDTTPSAKEDSIVQTKTKEIEDRLAEQRRQEELQKARSEKAVVP